MPASVGWKLFSASVALVAPAIALPLRCHWIVGAGEPDAETESVTVPPTADAGGVAGCVTITGVLPEMLNVRLIGPKASPCALVNSYARSCTVYEPAVVGVPEMVPVVA